MDPRIEASRNAVTQLEPQNVADAQEATCCPTLVSEFSWDNVNLTRQTSHGTIAWVDAFGHDSNRCLGEWSSFFAFRCFNALLMCSVLVGAMIDQELNYAGLEYYFIFLTNWTLIVQCVYLVLACYVTHSLRELVASGEHGTELEMPLSVKTLWLLQGVLVPGTCLVFLLYWGLVFDGTIHTFTIPTHGVNFLVQLADLLISSQPYLLLHGLYFFAYCMLFLAWSLIHYATGVGDGKGNRYIYSSLDWSNVSGTSSLALFILLLVVPLCNCFFWALVTYCRGQAPVEGQAEETPRVELEETQL